MSGETLKPCALCGADLHLSATENEREWGVECCGCDGILIFRPTREEAIAVANRRDDGAARAEAAAERTAEIVAMLEKDAAEWDEHGAKFPIGSRDQRDCRMRARYARLRVNAITARWTDAFPKPGGSDGR